MPCLWQTLLSSIIGGVIVACVSAWMALKRFRSERWWDRRADAYQRIVEALHYVKRGTEDSLDQLENRRMPDEEHQEELTAKYRAGWEEIRRANDTGSFLLPKAAQDALDTLMKEVDKADEGVDALNLNVYDAYGARLDAIRKCLGVLTGIARKDLSVARSLNL